jgi:site-specific DNA recombinase
MQVALYIRVSSPTQVEEGYSLEAQHKQLEQWAQNNGHIVVGLFEEPGDTATNDKRPQFQRI